MRCQHCGGAIITVHGETACASCGREPSLPPRAAKPKIERLSRRGGKRGPNWTPAEESRLVALIDAHRPYTEIAALLGRTEMAIRDRCAKLHASHRGNGYSGQRVARLLGIGCSKTVGWWCRQGWLRWHDVGLRYCKGPMHLIKHDDLVAFLEDERYWQVWQPERIVDAGLREWAQEMRAGVRYLTTAEVGERLYMSHYRVNQLIRKGKMRAVKWGPNWMVREDWVEMPVLECQSTRRPFSGSELALIKRLWGSVPATEIARKLGRCDGSIHLAARRLGLPRIGRGYWKQVKARKAA